MPNVSERIDQFRKMAADDPDNELGHFSLGRAYMDAGRNSEAVPSLQRAIQLNPALSRAYQLLGKALLDLDRRDEAIQTLTAGVPIAAQHHDSADQTEMTRLLQALGAPIPQLTPEASPQQPLKEGELLCHRCGQVRPKLPSPPFRNALGQEIQAKICQDCWRQWISMGTKVINELRLPLHDPQAQRIFDEHMLDFLRLR